MWTSFSRGAALASRFRQRQDGAVAVLFALMCIPVFLALAMAIDYSVLSRQKREMQDALDAAALAGARDPTLTDAEINLLAWQVFAANAPDLAEEPTITFVAQRVGDHVRVEANYTQENAFMGIGGFKTTDVGAMSEAGSGLGHLEVALVLDNTGSMNQDGKIGALKLAADKLIEVLYNPVVIRSDLKIAVIPFSAAVNVGSAFRAAPWIDKDGKAKSNGALFTSGSQSSSVLAAYADLGIEWKGCVMQRAKGYDVLDTEPNTADSETLFVPYFAPDEPDFASWPAGSYYANSYIPDGAGLLGKPIDEIQWDRAKYEGAEAEVSGGKGPEFNCGIAPLTPLSADEATVRTALLGMTANGNTVIPAGLAWGWHALTPTEPLTGAASMSDKTVRKVLILMTDGENNIAGLPNHNLISYNAYGFLPEGRLAPAKTLDQAMVELDNRTATLCANIKKAGITVYTLTFKQNSARARDLMLACASSPDKYSDNPTDADLIANFERIGRELAMLRLFE